MRDAVVPHGMAESRDDVVLAAHLVKALRTVAPVKRLVIGHRSEPTTWRRDRQRSGPRSRVAAVLVWEMSSTTTSCQARRPGAAVRSSQVPCGTQVNPLRAAAFRP